jgi:6-phosphogluconolactonase
LARFALTPDGGFAQREIIATEQQPRTFAIDPRGRFVLVAGELSNHLSIYALDAASGALRPKHRYPAGDKPVWLTVVDLP